MQICLCSTCVPGTVRVSRGHSIPWNWASSCRPTLVLAHLVLERESISALNCRAPSAPSFFFNQLKAPERGRQHRQQLLEHVKEQTGKEELFVLCQFPSEGSDYMRIALSD